MKEIILFFILLTNIALANTFSGTADKEFKFIKSVFSKATSVKAFEVLDPISENPINTNMYKVFKEKNELIGFYRRIITTTGCNSACLPIHVTLFYNSNKSFKTLKSDKGLTKKNHVPFTSADYSELELILNLNPKDFEKVSHPKDMVDVITGQTTKVYADDVVKEAAYTTLRVNRYNQNSLKQLKGI